MASYGLGFQSLDEECAGCDPEVEGSIPGWLSGTLYRNGPGRFETDAGGADHWFDGLAMLQRYALDGGRLTYSNRFLRTEASETAHESGFRGQFSAGGGYLRRLYAMFTGETTDNANVHVARMDDEYVAFTETPRAIAFDPDSLATEGEFRFTDDLSLQHVTAHYRRDEASGAWIGHGTSFGRTSEYVLYRIDDGSREREVVARYPVDDPAYLHSVGVTPGYLVIVEPPFVVDPIDFLLPGDPGFVDHFEWRPDRGARVLVFERESGRLVRETRTEPFFLFHHVNAFRTGREVVVDLVAYPNADIVTDLSLDALADGPSGVPDGEFRRYRIPLDPDESIDREDHYVGIELPRVAPDVRLQRYRYAYGQATGRAGRNGLVKVDLGVGTVTEWWDSNVFAEEPVFVPRPGGDTEDEGVVLATALDVDAARSFLLVLDGETFEERARAWLPHHLPFGFHGRFVNG